MSSLPHALSGPRFELQDPGVGKLAVYCAGQGVPLLLVHSVNAAGSAREVEPLFERYRGQRSVYALDLPGFGASERSDRVYSPRLMTDALQLVVSEIQRRHGAAPLDALGVSLGCEFLARAAQEQPARFRSLALVSPTGFNAGARLRGPAGSTRFMPALFAALRGPGWGGALFRALTRPGVIRYFLRRTWGSREIDEGLWEYDVIITREQGAEHAPLYFLAGGLFSADIQDVYDALSMPVWMAHGVRGDFTDYGGAQRVRGRANWHIQSFATGALPYFERLEEFCAAYDVFLGHSGAISAMP